MERLTDAQIQKLADRYNLAIDLEEGVVIASRKDGKELKPETVAKMVGKATTPSNWIQDEFGRVKGL